MKRYGNLFEQFCSEENIDRAARMSKKYRPENTAKICAMLRAGEFHPSPCHNVTIQQGGKERVLTILPEYPDKIIHRALLLTLRDIWDRIFIADSYCGIRGRGCIAAAKKLRRQIQQVRKDGEKVYCLKFDIRKFYPSIDHDIMKGVVRKSIKDKRILSLLDAIIDSEQGIMLGSPISPYLSNLYITYLCHWLKERKGAKYLINYADDFVILSCDKEFLHRLLAEIERYTDCKLKITVKGDKQIFPVARENRDKHGRGIDFVGFVFYLNETRIRKGIKQRLCRKIAKLGDASRPLSPRDFLQRISPWWGWLKYSDSNFFINQLNSICEHEIKFRC